MATPPLRITSAQNERFRLWQGYLEQPEAASCPWVAVEGWKQVAEVARTATVRLVLLDDRYQDRSDELPEAGCELVVLPHRLFVRLSRVRSPQGVIAFFDKPAWRWAHLPPWVIYLDRLQDPANLGLILRTAAACDFGVVTAPGTVSSCNDKVVRAAAGLLFRVPTLQGVSPETLAERGFRLWVADARAELDLWEVEFESPAALVIGREGGNAETRFPPGSGRVSIPMASGLDSLNAGIAASLLMYEVFRRRSARE